MKIFVALWFLVISGYAMAGPPAAGAPQYWRYPCDVILSLACFRLPSGMSVTYETSADFGIYTVRAGGSDLIAIYTGSAPDFSAVREGASIHLEYPRYQLDAYVKYAGEQRRVDILIRSKRDAAFVVHIFSSFTSAMAKNVAAVLSGVRPCHRQTREITKCPAESPWGEELVKWFLLHEPVNDTSGMKSAN